MTDEEKIKLMRDAAERILASDNYDEQYEILINTICELKEL